MIWAIFKKTTVGPETDRFPLWRAHFCESFCVFKIPGAKSIRRTSKHVPTPVLGLSLCRIAQFDVARCFLKRWPIAKTRVLQKRNFSACTAGKKKVTFAPRLDFYCAWGRARGDGRTFLRRSRYKHYPSSAAILSPFIPRRPVRRTPQRELPRGLILSQLGARRLFYPLLSPGGL